jgi:hypothetical protein
MIPRVIKYTMTRGWLSRENWTSYNITSENHLQDFCEYNIYLYKFIYI